MVRKLEEKSKFNRYKILSDSIDKKKVKKMQKLKLGLSLAFSLE